jgi:hypothetical protein
MKICRQEKYMKGFGLSTSGYNSSGQSRRFLDDYLDDYLAIFELG